MTPHEAITAERVLALSRAVLLQRRILRATERALVEATRELERVVDARDAVQAVH